MPTFFFDIDDGNRQTRDGTGQELPDREAAKRAAIASLPSIAADALPDHDQHLFKVEVRDEGGAVILDVSLELRTEWRS